MRSTSRRLPAFAAAALWAVCAAATLCGCQVQRRWNYQPAGGRSLAQQPLVAGVVFPFDESRPSPTQDADSRFLGIVPFVPYGTRLQHRPETGVGDHERFLLSAGEVTPRERELQRSIALIEDLDEKTRLQGELKALSDKRLQTQVESSGASLPEAAATSLWQEVSAASLFEGARLIRGPEDRRGCDIFLQGELIRTEERDGLVWYGFSIVAPLGWAFGLPSHATHARTAYRVRLIDYRGKPLAEFEYHAAAPARMSWRWGAHYYETLPPLWRDINAQLAADLRDFLSQKPPEYWSQYAKEARAAVRREGRR
jgi:hypothetical protein